MVKDGVEQREEQQGQLGQQSHPVVEVVLLGDHLGSVAPFCGIQAALEILQVTRSNKVEKEKERVSYKRLVKQEET